VHLAGIVVTVPPENELLEQEEQQDTGQQRQADGVRGLRAGAFERVRDEAEECRAEQRLRNVIGSEIGDGTAEIMKLNIAREMIGKEFQPL